LHELKDRSFDLVVSIFGAMFSPKPFDVAKEMVRVTRRSSGVFEELLLSSIHPGLAFLR
jgi:ubiquinone/menaquinone biosynthesis C-methylase UbiE